MGKRSNFEKVPRDFYPTIDPNAIPQTFVNQIRGRYYAEPCCGAGDLVDLLADVAMCKWESDVDYRGCGKKWDAMKLSRHELEKCEVIITNPPYTRKVLLPMIDHLTSLKPTWLLLPADMMHNKYFSDYMKRCRKVISVGRLKWIKGSPHTSTDNYAWYLFDAGRTKQTRFYGRTL